MTINSYLFAFTRQDDIDSIEAFLFASAETPQGKSAAEATNVATPTSRANPEADEHCQGSGESFYCSATEGE